jgi:hypothetical protein
MLTSPARLAALILAFLALASPSFARQDPRFALVASFPSPTISFQWEANERFAFRLEGSYSFSDDSFEYELGGQELVPGLRLPSSTFRFDSTSHTGTIALVGLITMHRTDRIRLYLAPRVLVGFSSQTTTQATAASSTGFVQFLPDGRSSQAWSSATSVPATIDSSYTSPGAGLSFGARSNVFDRVALFGEAGFTYSRSDTAPVSVTPTLSAIGSAESRRTTFGTRAIAGIMFLF